MDNIEFYDIHMSLSEGMIRNMFPKMTELLHGLTNRKNTMMALDDYVKRVSKGQEASGNLVMLVSKIYKDVEWRELGHLINKLVASNALPKQYAVDL